MMRIILLDVGNVLLSVDFLAFCRRVVPEGVAELHEVRSKYCEGELKASFERGMITPADYLGMIQSDPLTATMSHEEIEERWQNIFTLVQGAEEGVAALAGNHRIWIMSDTDPLHVSWFMNHFPLLRQKERYYLSYEHGFLKNSPEAFRHVLSHSGVPAEEFILIDDKPENCRSAALSGIRSILFNSWPETLAALASLHVSRRAPHQE